MKAPINIGLPASGNGSGAIVLSTGGFSGFGSSGFGSSGSGLSGSGSSGTVTLITGVTSEVFS